MKNLFIIFLTIATVLCSPLASAQQAKGVIQEIKLCGTGNDRQGLMRVLLFKVDGKWFGSYADYAYADRPTDLDDNITSSVVLMAYSQQLSVDVNATSEWPSLFSKCSVTSGAILSPQAGNYIHITR